MPVTQPVGLIDGVMQDTLAFRGERYLHRRGDALPDGDARFNLFADGFARPQQAPDQSLVFPQEAQQQVFGFDVGAAVLAGFVPGEEDRAPRLLSEALEHGLTLFSIQ